MPELEQPLSQMRGAWLAGRSAVGCCPPDWLPAAGDGPAAEAALAALVAHAAQTLFRPCAPALTLRPLLPQLGAPQISSEARSRFQRLLKVKADDTRTRGLIRLAAARGYVVHPADWLPGPRDDWAPEAYAPWLAWACAERGAGADSRAGAEALSTETYDDWSWAERRARLAVLRRTDSAAARKIIAARVGSESAEHRLKLLEILQQGLSLEDAPILEALAADRSDRVRALVGLFLARLGRGAGDPEAAAELASMVELARIGMIKRRRQLVLKPLKTQAQEARRRELLALVSLPGLAAAFGAPETALVESAPTGEPAATQRFVELVADTGSDAARRMLLDKILEDPESSINLAIPLSARATPDERAAALSRVAARESSPSLPVSLAFAGETLGVIEMRTLTQSAAYRSFTDLLRAVCDDDQAARAQAEATLKLALANLSLLLAPAAAAALIDICIATGIPNADPRLDYLHLNAALNPERPL